MSLSAAEGRVAEDSIAAEDADECSNSRVAAAAHWLSASFGSRLISVLESCWRSCTDFSRDTSTRAATATATAAGRGAAFLSRE